MKGMIIVSKFKSVLRIFFIVLSAFMILWYLISGIINIGSIFGIVFFLCIGARAIYSKKVYEFYQKCKSTRVKRIIIEIVSLICAAVVMYFISLTLFMVYCAHRAPKDGATVVVLGCQVNGNTPSVMLEERIKTAYNYLSDNPDAKCVVSGGKGENENISEAECMYNELVKLGIDKSRIYIEDKSTDTYENIKFSEKVISENGLNNNIAVVSDGFHQMRVAIITQKLGYSCGAISASTPFYLLANFSTREMLALTKEIVFN